MFSRLSASRAPVALTHFCGGPAPTTILSSGCAAALLPLLPTRALLRLRATCHEARAAAAAHPHEEGRLGPDVSRCCAAWRACLPSAAAANGSGLLREGAPPLAEQELAALRGLRALHMAGASEAQLGRVGAALPSVALLGPPPLPAESRGAPRRIRRELLDIGRDGPPHGCALAPTGNDLFQWSATLRGPAGSPYEEGFFHLSIEFPHNYPFKPPKIRFLTAPLHPNVNERGAISLCVLKDQWSPALTISKLMLSIKSLLADPNHSDPIRHDLGKLGRTNRAEFERLAREHTRLHHRF